MNIIVKSIFGKVDINDNFYRDFNKNKIINSVKHINRIVNSFDLIRFRKKKQKIIFEVKNVFSLSNNLFNLFTLKFENNTNIFLNNKCSNIYNKICIKYLDFNQQ